MPPDQPTIDEMRLALERASVNPSLVAQGRKARAHMTPPESVMDPRYAAWKKNQEDAELFGIASDIAFNAVPFVGPAVNVARKAAAPVARAAGEALTTRALSGESMIPGLPSYMAPNPLAFVVKPKGGNWLGGSVEDELNRLLTKAAGGTRMDTALKQMREAYPAETTHPDLLRSQQPVMNELERGSAINNWIDTKLNRYIKNEMATPEDPVRALAERGTLHVDPGNLPYGSHTIHSTEFPKMGSSMAARSWENASDYAITPGEARTYLHTRNGETGVSTLERNPWLAKVSPETPVYDLSQRGSRPDDLGFDHLIDELRNALDPASTLPRNLRLTPEQLSKVTVPQAVERVAKINAWREAQKAEANAARAMNPATVVHREYPTVPGTDLPNERGLRWVEMRSPQELPAGWREETREGRKWFFDPEGKAHNVDSDPRYAVLEDALKYEGETMGHCVGGSGYCQGVLSGQKRIYSLRDAKGQPHVTIEVQPMRGAELGRYAADLPDGPDLEAMKNPPLKIIQIKGKGNRKPNEEYLPFVQDFVQSGQWSEVGDIRNADMFKLPDNRFVTRKRFEEAIKKLSGKNTPATEVEWLSDQINRDPSWWKNVKPAFDEPAPVRQHKMLQGIYRGYAGEGNPAAAKVYGTPQRRVAEHYAQTRAAQTGQPPHMEMLMIDPFDVNKSYGHAPATQANQEPMVTQAKQLLPSQIKGRTQLYKKGGAVTADDMRYELMRNR